MSQIPVVDSHHHLWVLGQGNYPWLEGEVQDKAFGDNALMRHDYTFEDFAADIEGHNVVKSVHVEAAWDPADPVAETKWLHDIHVAHGYPHAIVGAAKLHLEAAPEIIAGHAEYPEVRSIRHILNWHPDPRKTFEDRNDYMTDPAWRRGFAELGKHGLHFDLQIYPSQMADAADLAGTFSDMQIILEHTGMPVDFGEEAYQEWQKGMRLMASCDNLTVKLSGLGMIDHSWTTESIRRYVLDTIDFFGPNRCMWGSNFPVDKQFSSFATLIEAYRELLSGFSQDEQRAILHDTATRVYRI